MALTRDTNDYNVHQGLPDNPYASGYKAAEIKALFDQAANQQQEYINDTLIPEIEAQYATKNEVQGIVLGEIPDGTITNEKFAEDVFPAVAATLTAAGWTGSAPPYSQTVSVAGVPATGGVIELYVSPDATEDEKYQIAAARVRKLTQGDGTVTAKADGVKPSINIPVVFMIWR